MATEVHIRVAERRDCELLAVTMVPADVAEVRRGGEEPLKILLEGYEQSLVTLAAWRGDELGCIFGVSVEETGTLLTPRPVMRIWSLTGPAFARYPVAFCKAARRVVRLLTREYGDLSNLVDAKHKAARRFLAFLGAELAPGSVEYGPLRQPFIPFRLKRASA